jgi:hypothetical protein
MIDHSDTNNMTKQPLPSIPLENASGHGGRKLNDSPQRNKSPSQSVGDDAIPRSLVSETCVMTTTILGFNYTDNFPFAFNTSNSNWTPSDPNGAVERNRLVAVANQIVEVRQKDGILVRRYRLLEFFSAIYETISYFSPHQQLRRLLQ